MPELGIEDHLRKIIEEYDKTDGYTVSPEMYAALEAARPALAWLAEYEEEQRDHTFDIEG